MRRRICQVKDAKDPFSGVTRGADLRAGIIMMNNGYKTNLRKRVGSVPRVEIRDIFFFRMEMFLVGLHTPRMAGIDYTSIRFGEEEELVAVSIVSSGAYEDDVDDGDVLIYSGQGRNINRKDKQVSDSCSSRLTLNLNGVVPFDTTSLHCDLVWDAEDYILRSGPNLWNFVLSAPYMDSYVAFGFSTVWKFKATWIAATHILDYKRSMHGVLDMIGWGILMIIGIIVARNFRQWGTLLVLFSRLHPVICFYLGINRSNLRVCLRRSSR
ncbi:hypothetical protein NE237_014647 [Protea cynaroides]|uniref:YDG domain-containing protein n=1 Tax=Protea cynaroides TaxID=273540 RepID=A0A9Q0KCG0_9MAGN|nr:hypothetical protein NE237_014647 [Protea cynaroides]